MVLRERRETPQTQSCETNYFRQRTVGELMRKQSYGYWGIEMQAKGRNRETYQQLYNESLIDQLNSELSGDFRVLVGLVSSFRYDKELVDTNVANVETAKLHDAVEKKHLDHDDVVWILGTRNVFSSKQLLSASSRTMEIASIRSLDQDIKNCGNGILESVLMVEIWCIDSTEKHFAEVIRASIVGFGTDEDSLTRAIVTRAETDMVKIREDYLNANKTSLDDAVISDTLGDYKDFLMTLLGARI